MSITAFSGPLISFGSAASNDYNPEAGPSLFFGGTGLLDPRGPFNYQPGQNFGAATCGFLGNSNILSVNAAPATKAAAAVAAVANVVSGTAMTLVSVTGSGITVGASVVNYNTGGTVTGLLAVGAAAGRTSFGDSGTIQLWDPTTLTARALSVTGVSASVGGDFLISGYDIYGVPMTETITAAAGVATTNGKKAFKYIASVVPQFTDANNYSVGTTDLFGLPIRSDLAGDITVNFNATLATSITTYVAAVTTTASATTGDVRGTIGIASASDGTKRLMVFQNPLVANVASVTGLFGVTQA